MELYPLNLLLIGLLSLLGLFAGQLAGRLGLPRVVAYVLVGVLFSTDFLGRFFPINSTDWVRPLTDISLNVIAFIIGGSITLPQLQRMGKSMLGIAVLHQYHGKGTFSSTLLGVEALDDAFGMIFFSIMMTFLVGGSLEQSLEMALIH